jgi:hypothetical protein
VVERFKGDSLLCLAMHVRMLNGMESLALCDFVQYKNAIEQIEILTNDVEKAAKS